jgi:NTP pyrophosphatase (non-canonical NTP hydrolase)
MEDQKGRSPIDTECLASIGAEYRRARQKFAPMRGPHEGYAVILEELDEAWDAIKANDIAHARKEILQVAAMALAFLLEVKE